ncbi:MAG: phage virion morphogenesis protein [Rhizobiaceae bacterium]|nr:phage virion morphogenesis protein [Rhizobiaceae bacterium]
MSVQIVVDVGDFDRAFRALRPIFDFQPEELMSTIGALGESQTRRRISEEKTSPDGEPWAPNRKGTSILMESGQHLLASVAWTASADEAVWGAAWEFAHVHQFGATIVPKNAEFLAVPNPAGGIFRSKEVTIPAREFVGISAENAAEIIDVVTDHFGIAQ